MCGMCNRRDTLGMDQRLIARMEAIAIANANKVAKITNKVASVSSTPKQ